MAKRVRVSGRPCSSVLGPEDCSETLQRELSILSVTRTPPEEMEEPLARREHFISQDFARHWEVVRQ